jgi:hypothetical protein
VSIWLTTAKLNTMILLPLRCSTMCLCNFLLPLSAWELGA